MLAFRDFDNVNVRLILRLSSYQILFELRLGKPVLEINQTNLDLGLISTGDEKSQEFIISNIGVGELNGKVRSSVDWLRVYPDWFRISAGRSVKISVRINKYAPSEEISGDLLPKLYSNYISIISNGGETTVPVSVEVVRPQISVTPKEFDFGKFINWDEKRFSLQVSNLGLGILRGELVDDVQKLLTNTKIS